MVWGTIMNTYMAKDIMRAPYAWPGGYPKFALCNDGGILCAHCCKENAKLIIGATRQEWAIVAIDINWEDESLYCDHCGKSIESAHGEEVMLS